eukprot:scaffold1883_cov108-Isochrysis_galbana.AAC.2
MRTKVGRKLGRKPRARWTLLPASAQGSRLVSGVPVDAHVHRRTADTMLIINISDIVSPMYGP